MERKTIFVIVFFIISFFILFMYSIADPVIHEGSKYTLPEPRDIDINGITFPISWGFTEDRNSSNQSYTEEILNSTVIKEERTFHQNDILLLDIEVYDFQGNIDSDDLNLLNDGTYENKTINGIKGLLKNESVETYSGPVKSEHPRYYFNYLKDGKLVMIQCDKLNTIDKIVS